MTATKCWTFHFKAEKREWPLVILVGGNYPKLIRLVTYGFSDAVTLKNSYLISRSRFNLTMTRLFRDTYFVSEILHRVKIMICTFAVSLHGSDHEFDGIGKCNQRKFDLILYKKFERPFFLFKVTQDILFIHDSSTDFSS